MANNTSHTSRAAETSMSILRSLLQAYHPRNFSIHLWDGTTWEPEAGQAAEFRLIVHDPGVLRGMLHAQSDRALAEAYVYRELDVEGNLEKAFPLVEYFAGLDLPLRHRVHIAMQLHRLPQSRAMRAGRQSANLTGEVHSIERDRKAVTYHYNTSSDFFRLYLDRQMVYSCAYFESPDDDLDTAQERKLDYICRKLRLKPGERMLDIGCGWGALIRHAVKVYGVSALGITLSEPQAKLANEQILKEGLESRCRAEVADYREVGRPEEFDKVVSVGMVEHVGKSKLREYFAQAWKLLRPGGLFLNHGITQVPLIRGRSTFSDAFVFPDGETLPFTANIQAAEEAGFEVRDVESLREHYALTLRHWLKRLEARYDEARRVTDEATCRVWKLYMTGSVYWFERAQLNVHQVLLAKPDKGVSGLPLTRADWYR